MRNLQIEYDEDTKIVSDKETGTYIFSALWIDGHDEMVMDVEVINKVVEIWNKTGNTTCLGQGELDEFLMNSGDCYQEEREIITEELFSYYIGYNTDDESDFAKFEKWMNELPLQTLTDELKDEIISYVATLIDM